MNKFDKMFIFILKHISGQISIISGYVGLFGELSRLVRGFQPHETLSRTCKQKLLKQF